MKKISLFVFLIAFFIEVKNSVIGIDLGTEFIKISFKKADRTFSMVENLQSKTKTPFAIGFKDDERTFGSEAHVKKSKIPEQVFVKMHEFLGKKYDDPSVRNFLREYFVSYHAEEDSERKTFSFKINFGLDNKEYVLSIEEIYAMVFRYIKFLSEKYSQSEIKDCVVTVPSFFGYKERLAIIQSVEISGLKLMHLISENTGAAVNYAMNNKFKKENIYLVLYNMGASYTQATLVSYVSKYIPSPEHKNKIIELQYAKIIDETWDKNLGGRNFDYNIVRYLAKLFYEQNNKQDRLVYLEENSDSDSDSNSNSNPKFNKMIEKMLPSVVKYKEILSANKEALINILGVEDGINLNTILTRQKFEEISQKDFDRVFLPVQELLNRNKNLNIDDITAIEFIGGGNRVPNVKEVFKKYVNNDKLGNHMNGDDSIALGTAFISANLTSSNGLTFNNKRTFLYNYGTNYGFKIKISNPEEGENTHPYCDSNKEDVTSDCIRIINKNATVIEIRRGFNLNKVVNFKHDSDFNVEVYEFFDNSENLGSHVITYKVKLTDAIMPSIMREKGYNNTMPRIHLKFYTDKLGVLSLKVEVSYEIVVYLSVTKESKTGYNFKYTTNKTEPLNANNLIDEISRINSNKNFTKSHKDKLIKMLKDEVGKTKIETRKKDVEVQIEGISPLPLNRTQIIKSRVKLNNFDAMDEKRAESAEKKNLLESLLYKKRHWSESEESLRCATEEELSRFKNEIHNIQNWYDHEGYKSDSNQITEAIKEIESLFNKFEHRLKVVKKRNSAVEYFHSELKSIVRESENLLKTKPWIEQFYKNEFTEKYTSLNDWINNKVEQQELIKFYEEPKLSEDEIYSKLELIRTEFKKVKRMQKPTEEEKKDM